MSSDNIQVIKTKILTLQKKQLCNEFRFKKYLLKVIETDNEKQINKFVNDTYNIINKTTTPISKPV